MENCNEKSKLETLSKLEIVVWFSESGQIRTFLPNPYLDPTLGYVNLYRIKLKLSFSNFQFKLSFFKFSGKFDNFKLSNGASQFFEKSLFLTEIKFNFLGCLNCKFWPKNGEFFRYFNADFFT